MIFAIFVLVSTILPHVIGGVHLCHTSIQDNHKKGYNAFLTPSSLNPVSHPPPGETRYVLTCEDRMSRESPFRPGNDEKLMCTVGEFPSVQRALQAIVAAMFSFNKEVRRMTDDACSNEEAYEMDELIRLDLSHDDREWMREIEPLILRALMYKKFEDPELRALLLATGDSEIMEDGITNTFWGIGMDAPIIKTKEAPHGAALNLTGRVLQEIRANLREGKIPRKQTLLIGDETYTRFQSESGPQEPLTVICCPGATTTFLLTLAETLQCPSLQHIVVGMGHQDLLPATSRRDIKASPQHMVDLTAEVFDIFSETTTHLTVVPTILPPNASEFMSERFADVYLALQRKFPSIRLNDFETIRYLDLLHIETPYNPQLDHEPAMSEAGHTIVMSHIKHFNRLASLHRIGFDHKRVPTWEDDSRFMKSRTRRCSCDNMWCIRCFKQSRR